MADRKRTDPDWEDLRIFLALGRHGSLSAAARALSVNHATIARRLRSLEASLGEKLVERRPNGYVLTSVGALTLATAGDMETAARTLGRDVSDSSPRGLVRINASPALAHGFLIARLAGLAVRYPALDIDLATDMRSVSLDRHETDIAIRLSRPDDGDVIAKRVLGMGFGYYGTPEACVRIENGAEPEFIGFDEANSQLPEALWVARHFPRARLTFRVSNQFAQAIVARSGRGVALLPHYIGRSEPALRLCKLEPAPSPRDVYLVTRRRDRENVAVRVVAEEIASFFHDEIALFG